MYSKEDGTPAAKLPNQIHGNTKKSRHNKIMEEKKKISKENLEKKKELWQYLKKKDMRSFIRIRYGILGQTMNIPGKSGRKISSLVYIVARRLIGFN